MIKRRQFIGLLGGSALGLLSGRAFSEDEDALSRYIAAKVPGPTGASGRVVVVGGGMAGATVAKFLRLWGGSQVQVTLVEQNPDYPSSILSNLVLNGSTTMDRITFKYDTLKNVYGINVVHGTVSGGDIDKVQKRIRAGNAWYPYDRLVLAPGIEFDYSGLPGLEGLSYSQLPLHAWIGGAQTTALRNQIANMPSSGTVVITIPPAPYRCPPGPYERACVIADYLKKKKRGARVIVLDANPDIVAERHGFSTAFAGIYGGIIEYYPGAVITGIDVATRTLQTNIGTIRASVLNVIPPQTAAKVVMDAGLVPFGSVRASVNVLSYESTIAPAIHVIGDSAAASPQPMAGHLANAQGKVCADAIVRILSGRALDPSPVTNSACFSPITAKTASWLSVVYAYKPPLPGGTGFGRMEAVPASFAEASEASSEHYEKMFKWFGNLMSDTFA